MARVKIELSPRQVESLEAMAGYGMSMEKIAHALGMSKVTLERRIKDSPPELGAKDAMTRGRAKAEAEVVQTAHRMATSGKESGMTQFWLQCRAGWKKEAETQKVELTGKDGGPVKTKSIELSTEELKKRVEERARVLASLDGSNS